MARDRARGAEEFVPAGADLDALRRAAASCRGCGLYMDATQTVFGEGEPGARVVLVGEMPGDREDVEGHPFVGPAGRLLGKALEDAGIDRSEAYVTNVVKHFKYTQAERGKRRLHQTPNRTEIVACRPWLVAELQVLEPEILVCLGATAAKAVFGQSFRITRQRGELLPLPELDGEPAGGDRARAMATIHPSAALRAEDREAVYQGMVADLQVAAGVLQARHREERAAYMPTCPEPTRTIFGSVIPAGYPQGPKPRRLTGGRRPAGVRTGAAQRPRVAIR